MRSFGRMKVSIVLPCYKSEAHIERCLRSLFAQTHRPLELIAVDDGSPDRTGEILEAAKQRCPYPMTVIHQANAGACAARNAGLRASTGSHIQFMDADDALLPGKIAHQAALAAAHPGTVICGRPVKVRDGRCEEERQFGITDNDPWLALTQHRLGQTSAMLFPKDAVEAVGGWDLAAKSSQEYELLFALLKRGTPVMHDEAPLTIVHRSAGSITTANEAATWHRYVDLRRRVLKHLADTGRMRNRRALEQALFDALRTLHLHDAAGAERIHAECFPQGFTPSASPATGRLYIALHRLLGFNRANRLARALRPSR